MPNAKCQVLNTKGLVSRDGRGALALPALHFSLLAFHSVFCVSLSASDLDEFKVKRQEVFEFTEKPAVARDGNRATVRFASKGYCDATVAVEDSKRRIVRHLASGVLGPNAPAPFQKDSLKQTVVWDGKDDRGRYVDNVDRLTVRVSLGLKPQFERTLFWSPKKRIGPPTALQYTTPIMVAAPEGVYVFEGGNGDHLRLFDHDGDYVRTVYPFPADKLEHVKGLKWQEFPQDGKRFPLKWTMPQNTLLTSARLEYGGRWPTGGWSSANPAAKTMAVRGRKVALANARLNRMKTDGSSGGLPLAGPTTSFQAVERTYLGRKGNLQVGPRSAAISPDARWLYLTGYYWPEYWGTGGTRHRWLDVVARVRLDGEPDAPPEVFLGNATYGKGGTDDKSFRAPVCVVCDGGGRLYVADYMNDRVQVFRPDGTLLRTIKAAKPAHLVLDEKGNALYVFSWLIVNPYLEKDPKLRVKATLTRFGPLEKPRPLEPTWQLPFPGYREQWNTWDRHGGSQYRITLDAWADPPRVWVAGLEASWTRAQIRLYELRGAKLALKRDFGAEAVKEVTWIRAPHFGRQRLYCNPRSGWVYVGEQHLPSNVLSKSIRDLVGIDPKTGRVRVVPLPFDAEDLAFDLQGHAYLRTRDIIVRYATNVQGGAWREVPFDYGEERRKVGNQGFRAIDVTSGVTAYGLSYVSGQGGGIAISPRGHIAMALDIRGKLDSRTDEKNIYSQDGRKYAPRVYPGRAVCWVVHVWDEHGKVLYDDALPGMGICSGLSIDNDDNLYILASGRRVLDGKPYVNDAACTLMKVKPKAAKVLSTGGVVPLERRPDRPADLSRWTGAGAAWIENAQWLYGGVGLDSHSIVAQIRNCHCEAISRPAFDAFARSFAPEINRYDVVVVDSNGNTILRIGRYGNVDDGVPLVRRGGPANPRAIGGDEVALVHGAHLATDTDRRLFIADLGNARILSVKLGYHATERVPVKSGSAE